MKVLLATPGRFHTMALARELQTRHALLRVVSGFPAFALKRERIEPDLLVTAPFYQTLHFGLGRFRIPAPYAEMKYRSTLSVDRKAASVLKGGKPLPDVYMALSQTGVVSGRIAKDLGVTYVCDRGSTHMEEQQAILDLEYRRHGLKPPRIDPRSIQRELLEYEAADIITVPSRFVLRSFLKRGVDASKLRVVPYGANLSMFRPTAVRTADAFEVLFVGALSIRKGIPYLLDAFARLRHPRKRLTLIGSPMPESAGLLGSFPADGVRVLGTVPQSQLAAHMSAAHVMVLPSVEEGLALVMAEALACGCPVLASASTGAEDLFDDGEEGFIVESRDVDALTSRLQRLADDPALVDGMSRKAREKIESIGGWADYADALLGHFARARAERTRLNTYGGTVQ